MMKVADALRKVTATMQRAIDSGERSTSIDAEDLIQVLLAVADEIDPPTGNLVAVHNACPGCGERNSDQLVWQNDDSVRCSVCGTVYEPGNPG